MTNRDDPHTSHQRLVTALEALKDAALRSCDAPALGLAALPARGIATLTDREPAYLPSVLTIAEEIYANALKIGVGVDVGAVVTDRFGGVAPAARAVVEEALRRTAAGPIRNSLPLPEPGIGDQQWDDYRRALNGNVH